MVEYQNAHSHKVVKSSKCKCGSMENMETYSKEIEQGKRKLKITLEFPQQPEQADTVCFERTLKELYIGKLQNGSLQKSLSALTSSTLKGEKEIGGLNYD